jgi:hypothetical protein
MASSSRKPSDSNASVDSDFEYEYTFNEASPGFTRHQVYETSFVLRQKLPRELVVPILNYAECWMRSAYIREEEVIVEEGNFNGGNCRYLCSEPIGSDGLTGIRPVKKVVFVLESHDQGWSSYPDNHGTYEDSWTWFEAQAVNAEAVEDDGTCTDNPEDREQMAGHNDSRAPGDLPWLAGGGNQITRNIHARLDWHKHVIAWAADDEDADGKWVRELERGQVIILSAHARFVSTLCLLFRAATNDSADILDGPIMSRVLRLRSTRLRCGNWLRRMPRCIEF